MSVLFNTGLYISWLKFLNTSRSIIQIKFVFTRILNSFFLGKLSFLATAPPLLSKGQKSLFKTLSTFRPNRPTKSLTKPNQHPVYFSPEVLGSQDSKAILVASGVCTPFWVLTKSDILCTCVSTPMPLVLPSKETHTDKPSLVQLLFSLHKDLWQFLELSQS